MSIFENDLRRRMKETQDRIRRNNFGFRQFMLPNIEEDQVDNRDFNLEDRISPPTQIADPYNTSQVDNFTRTRLRELLSSAPTPEQYKPSRGRKILGAIAGGLVGASRGGEAGVSAAEGITEAPYRKRLAQFNSEFAPLLKQYELEREDRKDTSQELAGIIDYLRAKSAISKADYEINPEAQARAAGLKVEAESRAKSPYEIQEENRKRESERIRQERELAGRKDVVGLEEKGRKERAESEATWRGSEAKLDRTSRESIAKRNADLRRELADKARKAKTPTKISVDQQIKAREDSESVILREVGADELAAIADPVKDNNRNIVGWVLKPQAKVPKGWEATWRIRRDDAARMADKMLGTAFEPNEEDKVDDGMGPWEEF